MSNPAPNPRPIHPLALILIALAVGALATTAIAWALAWAGPSFVTAYPLAPPTQPPTVWALPQHSQDKVALRERKSGVGWSREAAIVYASWRQQRGAIGWYGGDAPVIVSVRQTCGLPFPALAWDWPTGARLGPAQGALVIRAIALPLHPFPLGFVADTLIYATLFWFVCGGVPRWRRRRRRRRNQCPTCAYPIGASPTCTECGATLRS